MIFPLIGAVAGVQFMNAGVLWIFGYPSIYGTYLEGFYTKNPKRWPDHIFNIIFWIFISLAYFSYRKVSRKYGFIKTKLIYGLGVVFSFFFFILVILPILDWVFPE
ncbi:hypothetical protein [Bacillus sp. JCM 19041]|uniref:hypothetical protein n=1 Tax=Bacillus sp. JCM 19041 TaxID=1460637 RepID=UPI0006D070D6